MVASIPALMSSRPRKFAVGMVLAHQYLHQGDTAGGSIGEGMGPLPVTLAGQSLANEKGRQSGGRPDAPSHYLPGGGETSGRVPEGWLTEDHPPLLVGCKMVTVQRNGTRASNLALPHYQLRLTRQKLHRAHAALHAVAPFCSTTSCGYRPLHPRRAPGCHRARRPQGQAFGGR
jgi:hypothetical protein